MRDASRSPKQHPTGSRGNTNHMLRHAVGASTLMCRMVALQGNDPKVRASILDRFRTQADHGFTGPPSHRSHRDGWGIVGRVGGHLRHLGRSPFDASQDPQYETAVAASRSVDPDTYALAHVRNASVGKNRVENNHPFVRNGWAFCHNGTIRGDLQPPSGGTAEGETDSERFFLHLLAAKERLGSMEASIREVVSFLSQGFSYSSLTFLLTNGPELYALRSVGNSPGACRTRACALEHYTLGKGTWNGATVVTQEPQFLGKLENWRELPDGELLHLNRTGTMRRVQLGPLQAPADAPARVLQ